MTRPEPRRFRYHSAPGGVRLMSIGAPGSVTLVCLPCAGGVASGFRPLASHVPAHWRIVAVDPPGHGFNDAPLLDAIEPMVERYLRALEPELRGDYYLLGHSMGGLIAYLMARRLERGSRPPRGVLVCGARGPRRVTDEIWSSLPDAELIARLDAVGGIPSPFRANPGAFEEFLPPIRADFRALERFVFHGAEPLRTPLWAVTARDDRFVTPDRVREWLAHAARGRFRVLSAGGHFFPQTAPAELARLLAEAVGEDSAAPAPPAELTCDLAALRREVHVWLVDPAEIRSPAQLDRYHQLLSPDERVRHDRYLFERGRRQYLIARALLRTALSRYLGQSPSSWRFTTNSNGRPALVSAGAPPPLSFNLSHTDGLIALAVTAGRDVGVDVEDAERQTGALEFADQFLSANEHAGLQRVPAERRRRRFFAYWTLKEAYLKARGLGLSVPLDSCSFDLDGAAVEAAFEPLLRDNPRDWQFVQLQPTARHLLALAARRGGGPAPRVHWQWTVPLAEPDQSIRTRRLG